MKSLSFLLTTCICLLQCAAFSQSLLPQKNNPKIKVQPAAAIRAYAFNLKDVQLTGSSPFKHAMDIDGGYILSLSPDRLLNRFYKHAGLPPKDSIYGGWESAGVSGHTMGHYLSACAMMYAATGNKQFKERVDYVVGELAKCQAARGTGYVGAIPNEDSLWYKVQHGIIKSYNGYDASGAWIDLDGAWAPWYTIHKLMAGLTDVYLCCDNNTALAIVQKMADWVGTIVNGLTDAQRQQMLRAEFGGMNDVLANLYSITGEKKYLDLSYKFCDDFIMQPLAEGKEDPLAGKHSNTNIPKAIGSARQYELTQGKNDATIATRFWDIAVHSHTYVNGGNGNYEYFGAPGKLSDALSDNTTESCCAYNMLKLTGHLFTWQPDSKLADYYERTLYNDILTSQNPKTAMMLYFEPMRMGSKKQFSDSFNTFTCCVGTGMENHSKYTEDIYFEGADGSLYVNLFIPSRLNWKDKKIIINQHTAYPEKSNTTLIINTSSPKSFALRIRQPWWAANGAAVTINNKAIAAQKDTAGYLVINRTWKNKDKVEINFPMSLYTESMPDNKDRVAILYGPLVLTGNLGDTMPNPVYGTPVLLTNNHNAGDWAVKDNAQPLTFHTKGIGKPVDVMLSPFYKNIDNYYSVYWDLFTNEDWHNRQEQQELEKKRRLEAEAATIDVIRLGEMQPERDHNLQTSGQSYVSNAWGRAGREARTGGSFAFDIKVVAGAPAALLCTYTGDDKDRSFDILINDEKIASQELNGAAMGKFFDVEYPIPEALIKDKNTITVRIVAANSKTAGRIFECRTIRK